MARAIKVGSSTAGETMEQAAGAISNALDFLRRESDALGMLEVSELIGKARAKADERRLSSDSLDRYCR